MQKKTFKGKFNLRLPPAIHAKVNAAARREGLSQNQWVVAVICEALWRVKK